MEKRRFSRIEFEEKCVVEGGGNTIEARLLNVSLKGALIEFDGEIAFQMGERCRLSFNLGNADFYLEFMVEIVHCSDSLAGVRFVEADLNTMIHLRNLLEARTGDPLLVKRELDYFVDAEQFVAALRASGIQSMQ
jgi:hypothetical protein